ncbi:MAG: TfoX/Sxy family protein [Verrucomicrobiota bacterium]
MTFGDDWVLVGGMTPEIADRLRTPIENWEGFSEKKMFGGICFLLHGNMISGVTKDDDVMCRVGKDQYQEALDRPEASPMVMNGRTMGGYVLLDLDGLTAADLHAWMEMAQRFVRTLPPK